jgi:eukaryotic-like serine/threonine-protein kinase
MGAVYQAFDRDIDRTIALKVIRPDLASNPELLQRFKQELLLARQIAHKNVVRLFDVRESAGTKFITMEFIDGRDLRSLLVEQGKLPPAEAMEIMQQVCAGLAAAHAEGVIHRDLKPGNIMRDGNGRVVVMDFGLARTLDGGGMTQTGAMLGTMEYMSPEQAKAEPLDARSDLFTVGLILYELITGKTPYRAESAIATLLKRTQERAPAMSEIDASVPRSISAVVAKCLEIDPKDRYHSINDLIFALEGVQGKRPASVYPGPALPARRSRWIMAALAAVATVAIVALAVTALMRNRVAPTAHKTVTVLLADFENSTGDSVFEGTLESSFALALEGAPFISTYDRAKARDELSHVKNGATSLDEGSAELVAGRDGINVIVKGSIAKEGDSYKIAAKAIDGVTGKLIGSTEDKAAGKSAVLNALGSLAGKMRNVLGDTTPDSVKLAQEETFTSSSLEAAHQYELAQNLRYLGKSDEAIQAFKGAIVLDPNFGSAWGGMAALYWNLGDQAEAVKAYKTAMEHIDRMTDREKFRTRGGYYLAVRDGDKAVEEFSGLVRNYPADNMGLSALAFAYYEKHDMTDALDASRRAGIIYPRNAVYRNNAALYALYAADYDAALKEANAVLAINPAYEKAYVTIGLAQVGKGEFDKAAETMQKMAALGPIGASYAANGLADMALFRSDPVAAIPVLQKSIAANIATKNTAAAAKQYVILAEAQLMAGSKREALDSAAKALTTNKSNVLLRAAHFYANAGEAAKSKALASELEKENDPESRAYGKMVEGEAQLSQGQAQSAIELLRDAKQLNDAWLIRFELARAFVAANEFIDANSELDTCLKRRGEATDIYTDEEQTFRFLPPGYYYQGLALQGMKTGGSTEAFKNFLALKAPSAQDPLVVDAKRRIP